MIEKFVGDPLTPSTIAVPGDAADSRNSALFPMIFSHAGCIGDIIAALPTLRQNFRIGNGRADLILYPAPGPRELMSENTVRSLYWLLISQYYIGSVEFAQYPPCRGVMALDGWRQNPGDWPQIDSLADRHLRLFGWPIECRNTPWLHIDRPSLHPTMRADTIFCRSPRLHNPAFPWKQLHQKYPDAKFVGLPAEHDEFCRDVGPVPHIPTPDMAFAAAAIAEANLIVTNQTSLFWIAVGLGKKVILEQEPTGHDWNCCEHPNVTSVLTGVELLDS